ncbi:MAG: hypothetical protein JW963_20955 [Anaerolineales bacterium]|nr:hypothetical protein [Anaerolineales bacterium]
MATTSPRTYRFVPADIYTSGYRVVGKVMVANTGVIGLMNDTTKSAMEVHDARMAKIHMPTKLVDHFEMVRMVKQKVIVMCLSRREDLGPAALVRGGYGTITEYPARFTSQAYEVEGKLELPGRFDFQGMMFEGTRHFLPLFDAVLTAILIPNLRVESPGMLFNRNHADVVALLNQRTKEDKQE